MKYGAYLQARGEIRNNKMDTIRSKVDIFIIISNMFCVVVGLLVKQNKKEV